LNLDRLSKFNEKVATLEKMLGVRQRKFDSAAKTAAEAAAAAAAETEMIQTSQRRQSPRGAMGSGKKKRR